MGRTRRKRRNKKPRDYTICDGSPEHISLYKWLKSEGLVYNDKLALAVFGDTGRGVLTRRKISPGEEFMTMPISATLNVLTLIQDVTFKRFFSENKKQCFEDYSQCLTFQSLLAFYLVYQMSLKNSSKWKIYLDSLPREYTVPYFLPNSVLEHLDSGIVSIVTRQKQTVNSAFNIFHEILSNCLSDNLCIRELKSNFFLSEFEWAYFTVNTRCVYMDLTRAFNIKVTSDPLLMLVKDSMSIALCPYLDMINHSPRAKNETQLLLSKEVEYSLQNLDSVNMSETKFSIYTKNNFEPYSQVFICYGDSYNLKLITEYGFFLSNNDLDYVTFDYETVSSYLLQKGIKLSQEQIGFINKHGLKKNLYIDFKGLSFNFYAFLMVVKYYYKEGIDVNKIIYSSMDIFCDSGVNELVLPFIGERVHQINYSISVIRDLNVNCFSMCNCLELMCQYVKILEKFIKCQSK